MPPTPLIDSQSDLSDDEWYSRVQAERKVQYDEAERKHTAKEFDENHPDFISSAYEIIDDGALVIPGTCANCIFYLKLKEPLYKGNANDLKVMRNKLRYAKSFANDLRSMNSNEIVQVAQLEWAWFAVIMRAAESGAMAGPHQPYSFHWIVILWELYLQVRSREAEEMWDSRQKSDPSLDLELRNDYTWYFLQWFFGVIRKSSAQVKARLQTTLFPPAWLGPLTSKKMYGVGTALNMELKMPDNSGIGMDVDEEEWEVCGPMDGEDEDMAVASNEPMSEEGQSIHVDTANLEDFIAASEKVNLDDIERAEIEEEEALAALVHDTGAMDLED